MSPFLETRDQIGYNKNYCWVTIYTDCQHQHEKKKEIFVTLTHFRRERHGLPVYVEEKEVRQVGQ